MKKLLIPFGVVLIGTIQLVGCGHPKGGDTPPEMLAFDQPIQVRWPVVLARKEDRFQRFLGRARHITVLARISQKELIRKEIPASSWKTVPGINWPEQIQNEPVLVRVEIWDNQKDNNPRPFPALIGETWISRAKPGEKANSAEIKLAMQVSVTDYD